MKRYISLFLVLVLLLPCLIVPASATTLTGTYDALISSNVASILSYLKELNTNFASYLYQWDSFFTDGQWLTDLSGMLAGFGDAFITPVSDWLAEIDAYFLEDTELFVYWDRDGDGEAEIDYVTGFEDDLIALFVYCRDVLFNKGWAFYDYFFTFESVGTYVQYYVASNGRLATRYVSQNKCSDFQCDLYYLQQTIMVGLYNAIGPMHSYLATIVDKIDALLVGDSEKSDAFDDDMAPIETQVEEWIDSMETAPTINVDDIETEVEKVTDFEPDANYLSILSGIFLNEAFLMMFTWCVILAMLGFILYGKR